MAQQFEGLAREQATRRRRGRCAGAEHRTGDLIADRIRLIAWLPPEQTIITSTCGFNHLPRHIALGKMRAMVEAKAILSADVSRAKHERRSPRRSHTSTGFGKPKDDCGLPQAASGIGWFEWDLATDAWEWTKPRWHSCSVRSDRAPRASFPEWEPAIFIDDVPKLRSAAR